ncbi:hypothetical protein C1I93_09850 [Micromonospora endophytica]|uniref:TIGR03083 family protein n=1 Tax=Micromonospora endophytica TaxID=515350 RepID=A0A2W2DE01_9ACTN|nr:hypothetical protein C1I93_09850 [Micromonospora endophytica]RIW49470.1 hypothetical protein D3H59_04255 [Micromonospora endophytica]
MTPHQWATVRAALRDTGDRFAHLLHANADASTRATAHWTVAQTAAHVGSIAWLYRALIAAEPLTPPVPGFGELARSLTVETIYQVNDLLLAHFTERAPDALGTGLRADIAHILTITDGRDPATPVAWLGGARIPVAGLLAHLLNEILIHGWDIARAARLRWDLPSDQAALFLDLFVVGMLRESYGRLLDNDEPPRQRRIAVRIRSPHTRAVTLVLHRGRVTVEDPAPDADATVTVDPAVFNLMMFGRIGKLRAVLSGGVRIHGRRPWVVPTLLRTVRFPNQPSPLSASQHVR